MVFWQPMLARIKTENHFECAIKDILSDAIRLGDSLGADYAGCDTRALESSSHAAFSKIANTFSISIQKAQTVSFTFVLPLYRVTVTSL